MQTVDKADYMSPHVRRAWRFYHPDWAREAVSGLRLVGGGCEWCQSNFIIDRAEFPYWAFEFVVSGEGELVLAGQKYPLRPGVAFNYGPGIRQRITSSAAKPLVKYFINFVHPDGAAWLRDCRMPPGTLLQVGRPAKVTAALDDCIAESLSGDRDAARLAELHLEVAVRSAAADALPADEQSKGGHTNYLRCRDLLTRRYLELTSVEDAAQTCGISAPHLCRLFKRHGPGVTPHQLLTRLRLAHGAHLLSQGRLVKEAAHGCGYSDTGHFSRLFHQQYGCAPGTFR